MLEVGDKVLCVDDSIKVEMLFPVINMYVNWVKKGRIYTIREILHNDDIVVGILLEEISNPIVFIKLIGRKQEPAFATWRFEKRQEAELEEFNEAELSIIEQEILANEYN
jgi:hypothetical protein